MKLSKVSQLVLVSAIGLLASTFLSGCLIVTIDYVFVACSSGSGSGSTGQIQIYAVDSQSGALRTGGTSVPSGGSKPVAMATTADYANLYVANQSNNSLVHFTVGPDGQLTQKDLVTVPFVPASIAVNQAATYIYVAGGSGPGHLAAYPLASGTIGTLASNTSLTVPGYSSDVLVPTAVTVLPNNAAVYVTGYDQSAYNPGGTVTSAANPGWLYGFAVGSGGALSVAAGSPYQAGVKPSALATDPTNRFVYATDYASNQLIGYTVQAGTALNFMLNGPFRTGNEPVAVVVDPRGLYIYVANALQSTVTAYSIALPTGTPSGLVSTGSGNGAYSTDTEPVSILVDPALGRFVYTANYLGNSVSGLRLDPNAGTLTANQATPYPTGAYPTAIVSVPHGNHSVQAVAP